MEAGERTKQVLAGVGVIIGFSGLLVLVAMGRFLPGLGGEFFARILGIISTPFLMELILAAMGLVLILSLNHWRQRREGDELVYLEEVQDPTSEMPGRPRGRIDPKPPLRPEQASATDLLEGALAIGDHAAALEILNTMDHDTRSEPEVIRHRITLARATGKTELALQLDEELARRTN